MNLSRFFIDRPIFAGVLSVLMLVAGLLALRVLPISEYPEVVPPSVVVRAIYPGANPKVIAETVATPLEEAINGVEDMLYMGSQATTDGLMTLTVTFKLGTDPDHAQQLVQNRIAQAEARLPEEVRRLGLTTVKSSPDLTMVVHLVSPNSSSLCSRPCALTDICRSMPGTLGEAPTTPAAACTFCSRMACTMSLADSPRWATFCGSSQTRIE